MKRLLFFAVAALTLVWVMRELEYEGIRRSNLPEFYKLRKTFLEKNDAQLLILGSSRAACQFVPNIIETATGLKTWNAGMTGATLPLFRTTLEAWLENNSPPKVVLINLDIHALNDANDTVFDYPRYFPYLSNNALYKGLKKQDEKFEVYRYIAPYALAQGNTRLLNAGLRGWFSSAPVADSGGYESSVKRGYSGNMDSLIKFGKAVMPSEHYIRELNALIQLCKNNNIQPILILSPLYYYRKSNITNYDSIVLKLVSIAKANEIQLIDTSSLGISYNQRYFTDPAHLNLEGATIYSRLAGMKINRCLSTH